MNLDFLLYGSAFVALSGYLGFRAKRTDPRFAGFRMACKGGVFFFFGWTILATTCNREHLQQLQVIGYIFIMVGFPISFYGFIKHARLMFGSGRFDARREVDPGYDLLYKLCPNCKKIEIRMYRRKMKCPQCGAAIKSE
jgi:hypothetical protein